jgi:hypothetical protein
MHQRTPSGRIPPWKLDLDELERYRKPAVELQQHGRETRRFYKHQNELIRLFSEMDQVHHGYQKLDDEVPSLLPDGEDVHPDEQATIAMPSEETKNTAGATELQVRIAIYLSLVANFLLLVMKVRGCMCVSVCLSVCLSVCCVCYGCGWVWLLFCSESFLFDSPTCAFAFSLDVCNVGLLHKSCFSW